MNVKHFLFYLLILILVSSCQTTPSEYFKRPVIKRAINSNCTAFQNGRIIDATNFISIDPQDVQIADEYVDDIEKRLYACIRFPKRCK